jgi:hypothetical protein
MHLNSSVVEATTRRCNQKERAKLIEETRNKKKSSFRMERIKPWEGGTSYTGGWSKGDEVRGAGGCTICEGIVQSWSCNNQGGEGC